MTEQLKKFAGSGNTYTEIATRGSETLGIDLKYAIHHTGVGALIVRFAIHNEAVEFQPLKHFTLRGHSQYVPLDATGHKVYDATFTGLRLNKVAIPVFNPAPAFPYLAAAFDQFSLWPVFAGWFTEQMKAEGFTPVVDVEAFLKSELSLPVPDLAAMQMIVEFPDLTLVKAHTDYESPAPSHGHDDDADPDEDDEDDPDEDEDTIN